MKRSFITILIISILVMTGCAEKPILGEELIEKARQEYAKLDSATVVVTDVDTGETSQTFSFNYKDNGDMVYLYDGVLQGEQYIEYNDAETLYIKKDGEITATNKNDKDFKKFTKDDPHPDATEELILFTRDYIEEMIALNER